MVIVKSGKNSDSTYIVVNGGFSIHKSGQMRIRLFCGKKINKNDKYNHESRYFCASLIAFFTSFKLRLLVPGHFYFYAVSKF